MSKYFFIVLLLSVLAGCHKQEGQRLGLNMVSVDGMRNDDTGKFDSFSNSVTTLRLKLPIHL